MRIIEPIAIVGIGCRMPGGVRSPDDLWKLLVDGVDAISEVPQDRWLLSAMYHPDPTKPGRMYARSAGFLDHIDRFDAQFFGISPREAAAADPQQRLLLELAYEAVEDAGLTLSALAGKRAGVYIGLTNYDYSPLQDERTIIDAYSCLGLAQCIAANRISYFFNLVGPSLMLDTACSSSLVAVDLACQSIWNGDSELAFAGGANLMLRPETTIAAAKASMLAPDCRCKAFDSRANGFARGEGGGIVILKPAAKALADGDRIYALVRATAVNQDGRTEGITVPSRASQEENSRNALRLAGIAPESIQYVEAHGTGTPVGDPIEAAALGAVYGKAREPGDPCVIGSVKTNIGHLEAGAGVTGLIKAALCLQHRQIPKNLHFIEPNPNIPFDDLRLRVAQQLEPWPETRGQPARAAVNSFGFGGTNGHAILEAAPAAEIAASGESDEGRAWMLPLSARSASTLPDLARSYLNSLRDECGLGSAALRDICYSASVKRSHFEHRLALVAHDKAELAELLEAFLRGEEIANSSTGRPSGEPERPVFVCSGMGQQWWAMGRELLTSDPVYRRAVEEVNDLYTPLAGWSLIDKLTADENSSEVQRTHVAQPAIFATQVGIHAMWRAWGVEPAAVFGHSAGEVVASYIAGALSLADAVRVVYHRSTLLRRTVGQGSMLAAGISRAEAERLVALNPRDISIAAVNAARSVTLSGNAAILAEIDKTLNDAGVFSRPLQVEAPFHSPKVDQIETDLLEGLRDIRPLPASIPFFSTVTGTAVTGLEVDRSYWFRNARWPVLFSDVMEAVIKAGHRLFLEIGAHPVLRYDIAACLKENAASGTTLASIRRGDRERAAMLGSLGRMHTIGAEIDWDKVFPAEAAAIKLPSYPFQADTHWREPESTRRMRLGVSIHPLLGDRHETPQPTWRVAIDTAGLSYLPDHRVGGAIAFPAAGYVEMGLAAAREIFGPVPCVVEDIEFQKMLFVDDTAACSVQVVLDAQSRDFSVHARADASQDVWDVHARGRIRQGSRRPAAIDLAQIRARCPVPVDREGHYRVFAEMTIDYGPSFRGIANLWRGEREVLAEIHVPSGVREQVADYRLHPAVLDACLHSLMAALSEQWSAGQKDELFLPAKIGRIRFHAAPSERLFAHSRLRASRPGEIAADLLIVDETGAVLVEVEGLVLWLAGSRTQGLHSSLYEYQWKYAPRPLPGRTRDSHHIPSPEVIASVMQEAGEALRKRLDRPRYQDRFLALSRSAAAAYMVRALRELGWDPQRCAGMSTEALADHLGVTPDYHAWLRVVLKQLTPDDIASTEEPHRLWKALWDEFPDVYAEVMLARICGEKLPAILRGDVDPLDVIFPDGGLTTAEHLYQDAPTWRAGNLLVQKAVGELVRRRPKGKALRVLEIGGGTGGMTSFVLPVLSGHCTEYVFTDVSPRFLGAHANQKFSQYPFVQLRMLDIERDPGEQGFEPHSFDLILASDVLHATKDLRQTVDHVKQLLGSSGGLVLLETTRPWLYATLTFGLLKGWWLFKDHDLRPDEPYLTQEQWKGLLHDAGFSATVCVADCPNPDIAPHTVILTRGPQLLAAPAVVPQAPEDSKSWLLFVDEGTPDRQSAGAALARELQARGDRVIEVTHRAEFRQAGSAFSIRAGDPDDMRRLMDRLGRTTPSLAGIVHLWSLDTTTIESMTTDALKSSARLGCVGVLHLLQAVAATDGLTVDSVWLVTRAAQPIDDRADPIDVMQSPLWGLGRVAISEYQNMHCRLVDLATCSGEEIEALADEMNAPEEAEDEIALHGELRYVRRLVPVSPSTMHRLGRPTEAVAQPFRIELQRVGIIDSLAARPLARTPPGPHEIEVEVEATGLNFKDLMLGMGMLPKDAVTEESAGGTLLGIECAGRVVAVGDQVSEFSVGDEVFGGGARALTSHITIDARYAAHKPPQLSFEQAATIPVAFMTALPSLHTLGQLQPGERVLIHSGTGGVGLAVVQMALQAGAIVFATAGSPEKRDLLKALGVHHVMDSRSLAFADEVMALTGGEGVDLVVNSLAGEALEQSLSLVREFGRFIDIGLRDIYQNRKIGMRPLRNCLSVFAFNLTNIFISRQDQVRAMVSDLARRFERNELRALPHRVFPVQRVADAFRYMAQAKHVGKLVVSMKDAEGLSVDRAPQPITIDPDGSYLITGGLGGLGLAMADRLARNGARHLALLGRSSPSPVARAAVDALRQRGVEVMICRADITDRAQTEHIVAEVQRAMGPLRGVLHAAMVLDDSSMELLTEEKMWTAMAPKIMGAWNLHELTVDAPLDFFILCSSVSSIIGNPGQANYAAGCAFLDALAYYRRERGLPALTVNFGMLGEIGTLAANLEASERLQRFGLKALRVSETLDTLDELLAGDAVQIMMAHIDWKVFGRMSVLRKPARIAALIGETGAQDGNATAGARVSDILEADATALPSLLEGYIRDHLARAMGALPARIDTQRSLLSLGLDSLMAVEMRNRLNEDLGVNVPLEKFMHGASIQTVACYMAERLLEGGRGAPTGTADIGVQSEAGSDSPLNREDAADLLERIDELTDAEIDQHLDVLAARG